MAVVALAVGIIIFFVDRCRLCLFNPPLALLFVFDILLHDSRSILMFVFDQINRPGNALLFFFLFYQLTIDSLIAFATEALHHHLQIGL